MYCNLLKKNQSDLKQPRLMIYTLSKFGGKILVVKSQAGSRKGYSPVPCPLSGQKEVTRRAVKNAWRVLLVGGPCSGIWTCFLYYSCGTCVNCSTENIITIITTKYNARKWTYIEYRVVLQIFSLVAKNCWVLHI